MLKNHDGRKALERQQLETNLRKLIAGMKTSVDAKYEGPDGYADWVDTWSEDFGLTSQIDACLVGARMYPGYEKYWSAIQLAPDEPLPMTGKRATAEELRWARFAQQTTHYVLSRMLTSADWPKTEFVRRLEDVEALKHLPGKDIYVMGGAGLVVGLLEAGLVDEIRLIVYPLIAGKGKDLFSGTNIRRALELRKVQEMKDGCVRLDYGVR